MTASNDRPLRFGAAPLENAGKHSLGMADRSGDVRNYDIASPRALAPRPGGRMVSSTERHAAARGAPITTSPRDATADAYHWPLRSDAPRDRSCSSTPRRPSPRRIRATAMAFERSSRALAYDGQLHRAACGRERTPVRLHFGVHPERTRCSCAIGL